MLSCECRSTQPPKTSRSKLPQNSEILKLFSFSPQKQTGKTKRSTLHAKSQRDPGSTNGLNDWQTCMQYAVGNR